MAHTPLTLPPSAGVHSLASSSGASDGADWNVIAGCAASTGSASSVRSPSSRPTVARRRALRIEHARVSPRYQDRLYDQPLDGAELRVAGGECQRRLDSGVEDPAVV